MWSLFRSKNKETPKTDNKLEVHENGGLIPSLQIPEPTKSLLWVTDEDTSKISGPMQIKIEIKVTSKGVEAETIDDSYNIFSEPSLIWTKLPVERNSELETQAMYYPSYSGLSPKHRYQYLNWLRDVTQETNLSYVFLYYYGLERHMLLGNYDLAVDEVIRLINHHKKSSFRTYAINALILASGYRKRTDIVKKAQFILEDSSPVALYIQYLAHDPLTAKEIINLSSRVGYSNKRYIKELPELFEKELQTVINEYESKRGSIWDSVDLSKIKENSYAYIANYSVPDNIRNIKIASPIDDPDFCSLVRELLKTTHQKVKDSKKRA